MAHSDKSIAAVRELAAMQTIRITNVPVLFTCSTELHQPLLWQCFCWAQFFRIMPISKKEVRNGIEYNWNEYSPEEMQNYWLQNDRYINDAKLMNNGCVIVECTEQQAKEIAAYFVNNLFAIPTCTFYDGKKLSLCIDYAGRNSGSLRDKTKEYVSKYLGVS